MPTVSKLRASGTIPAALTRPYVALKPTIPQYAAGRSVDPTVCDPSARGAISALTAAADPLDEPPGVCSRFHGLRVSAGSRLANSVVVALPRMIAPARRSRATAAASASGRSWKTGAAPAVVTKPAV